MCVYITTQEGECYKWEVHASVARPDTVLQTYIIVSKIFKLLSVNLKKFLNLKIMKYGMYQKENIQINQNVLGQIVASEESNDYFDKPQ